jgi:hypothetical protein
MMLLPCRSGYGSLERSRDSHREGGGEDHGRVRGCEYVQTSQFDRASDVVGKALADELHVSMRGEGTLAVMTQWKTRLT